MLRVNERKYALSDEVAALWTRLKVHTFSRLPATYENLLFQVCCYIILAQIYIKVKSTYIFGTLLYLVTRTGIEPMIPP